MKQYFYLDKQNKQQGPMAADRLPDFGVTTTTLVWCNDMSDWAPAGSVPELRAVFDRREQENNPYNSNRPQSSGSFTSRRPSPSAADFNSGDTGRPPLPDSHLFAAILVTIFCCLPFGAYSIYKASKVSNLYIRGLYDEAYLASEDAKKWVIISIVTGILLAAFGGIFL